MNNFPRRPYYGIDAPREIRRLLLFSLINLAAALVIRAFRFSYDIQFLYVFELAQYGIALCFMLIPLALYVTSRWCKVPQREKLLNSISLNGAERVLDVGCGRGLFVVGAARRLTTGLVVGVDIWNNNDLTGNGKSAVLENARCEGVFDKLTVIDADARELPFDDQSFDLVLSNLAIHTIAHAEERERALREILRVLKPGGRVVIQDFMLCDQYAEALTRWGARDVCISARDWMLFPPVRSVIGHKPG